MVLPDDIRLAQQMLAHEGQLPRLQMKRFRQSDPTAVSFTREARRSGRANPDRIARGRKPEAFGGPTGAVRLRE